MAAYAAVVTLIHTIEQIQLHPLPPISLDKNQLQSLTQNLTFLQEFLEDYSTEDGLVSRIAAAAYAAEDIIESAVVDQFLDGEKKFYECLLKVVHQVVAESTTHDVREFYECLQQVVLQILARSADHEESCKFHECLQKVVEGMDLIKKEAMEIFKETTSSSPMEVFSSLRSSFTGHNVAVVGFDDVLIELMDKLTGQESYCQIIPIVGMGGIGKTTLARTVYSSKLIQEHFDVCAWTTISQVYNVREIVIQVLSQVSKVSKEDLSDKSEHYLKETLHKFLSGRRYLIIIDDIWDIEVWEDIHLFFPDCGNNSRVIITTRLSNLANQLVNEDSSCLKMKFLDDDKSWNLFCKIVFGEDDCPVDLEEIGKKIVRGCKGLPLSISVIGGLLAKSKHEVEYWEYVAGNISSVVNSDSNEHCLNILHMSYTQLPTHLKPCFLYMGVFPEDRRIRVSELIELWVDEGFLKQIDGKPQEVVAQEYFHELVDRNLILVHKMGSVGNMKYCNIHDLLRGLCLREAQKERFHNVLMLHDIYTAQANTNRKDHVPPEWCLLLQKKSHDALQSIQLFYYSWRSPTRLNSRLLRMWTKWHQGVAKQEGMSDLTSNFWHLSTLKEQNSMILRKPSEIWKMPQLRHVRVGKLDLPDPPYGNDIILENLQTLSGILNFKCSGEIIKRIPNLKKLKAAYTIYLHGGMASCNFLNNIEHLCKLESFEVSLIPNFSGIFQNLTFPNSLKKLSIKTFQAEELLEKIAWLPHLVKLKLRGGFFNKREWVTVEGQFRSLRFLLIQECYQLEFWRTESSHFPCLEHLTLHSLDDLSEIPSDVGDIPTLLSISMKWCSKSLVASARKIKEEQEEMGNESLQLQIETLRAPSISRSSLVSLQ